MSEPDNQARAEAWLKKELLRGGEDWDRPLLVASLKALLDDRDASPALARWIIDKLKASPKAQYHPPTDDRDLTHEVYGWMHVLVGRAGMVPMYEEQHRRDEARVRELEAEVERKDKAIRAALAENERESALLVDCDTNRLLHGWARIIDSMVSTLRAALSGSPAPAPTTEGSAATPEEPGSVLRARMYEDPNEPEGEMR